MRVYLMTGILLALTSTANALVRTSEVDRNYFTIKNVKVMQVEEVEGFTPLAPGRILQDCDTDSEFERFQTPFKILTGLSRASQILAEAEVVLDQVVNIGRKIINLVAEGRPVVKTEMEVAHALPKGVQCWSDLSNWSAPKSTAYRVVYTNLYNVDVVDFTYRLSYIYGGQKDGRGRYITQATVNPAKLDVSWGFTFNAKASVPSVYNVGTKSAPVAGMQVDIKWSVDTLLQHKEQTDSFSINGFGDTEKL